MSKNNKVLKYKMMNKLSLTMAWVQQDAGIPSFQKWEADQVYLFFPAIP